MSQGNGGRNGRGEGAGNAQPDGQSGSRGPDRGRSLAEWVSFGISVAIIVCVVILVLVQHQTRNPEPATIQVRPLLDQVRQDAGTYYLPLEIINTGGETAEDVMVEVELTPARGEQERAELTIHFLAGGGSHGATAVFSTDPRQGTLTATARSFVEP